MDDPTRPTLDTALLAGFTFACRPDCGLCCYASPRVNSVERAAILRIAPDAPIVGSGRDRFLASRPDGGACSFLTRTRCRIHPVRPGPCREFPVTVHVGERLQATVVLSCPGLDLAPLRGVLVAERLREPTGLTTEVSSIEGRIDGSVRALLATAQTRRRKIARGLEAEGRWQPEGEVRARLRRSLPAPGPADFPVEDPPEAEQGLDNLPLFFDARPGPVAFARALGGWELLELSPGGGVTRSLGVVPPPERPPRLQPAAAELLRGYLGYWLERDALFGYVLRQMTQEHHGDVTSWVARELRTLGAHVLARGGVRAKLRRASNEPLTESDVADGIRALDQDALDRPTWGDRL